MNSIIKVYNLSLGEAINTRDADGAKDAALTELSQIIEKGCLMSMDRLSIKKLKADKQLVPVEAVPEVQVPTCRNVRQVQGSLSRRWTLPES